MKTFISYLFYLLASGINYALIVMDISFINTFQSATIAAGVSSVLMSATACWVFYNLRKW